MAKILVVDDNLLIRTLLRDSLEEAGHEVVEATDGVDGTDVFLETWPDLVITDLIMPKLGGLSFIKEIRARSPDTRVIALSGAAGERKSTFFATAGTLPGVYTASKPLPRAKLLALVERALSASVSDP